MTAHSAQMPRVNATPLGSWGPFDDLRRLLARDTALADERRAFGEHAQRRTVSHASGLLLLIAFSTLLWWPFDALIFDDPHLVAAAFFDWRLNNLCTAGAFTVVTSVLRRPPFASSRWSVLVGYAAAVLAYGWVSFSTAAAVAQLDRPWEHWIYYAYLVPALSIAFVLPLASRAAVALLGASTSTLGFLVEAPDVLAYPLFGNFLSLLMFATFGAVLMGQVVYVLVREGFYRARYMERRISEQTRGLRRLTHALHEAAERERASIGRELHDELGQGLAAIRFESESVARSIERLELQPHLRPRCLAGAARIGDLSATLTEDVRRIIAELRPRLLENLGLTQACLALVESFRQRSGIDVELRAEELRPAPHVALAVYRILQEALHNVEKHARATHVTVELFEDTGGITVEVKDDGVGFDPSEPSRSSGIGLLGIRERAEALGGRAELMGGSGERGVTVRATLPMAGEV